MPGNACSGDGGCCAPPCKAIPATHRPEGAKRPPWPGVGRSGPQGALCEHAGAGTRARPAPNVVVT
eukprot:1647239-Lingulodinium_polyedra.AAC.1